MENNNNIEQNNQQLNTSQTQFQTINNIVNEPRKRKPKLAVILLIVAFILFGVYKFLPSLSSKNSSNNNNNNNNNDYVKHSFVLYGGEFKDNISIKSYDLKSRMKVTIPSLSETGFSCNGGSDFSVSCDSKYISVNASTDTGGTYIEKSEESYNFFESNDNVKFTKSLECFDNSRCYVVGFKKDGQYPTKNEYLDIFIKGSNNKEYFSIRYLFLEGNAESHLKEILNNIKITNTAEYTIGNKKDDKLNIKFKYDVNDINPYSYLDLVLDGNKYNEVENGNNTVNRTVVKTNNSGNINLYYTSNQYYKDNVEYETYFPPIKNDVYIFQYPIQDKERYQETKVNDNVSIIYDKTKKRYNIKYNQCLLTVIFENENDKYLINDFINVSGRINDYEIH